MILAEASSQAARVSRACPPIILLWSARYTRISTISSAGTWRAPLEAVIIWCQDRELARTRSSMRDIALAERGPRPLQDHPRGEAFPAISALARLPKERLHCPFGHGLADQSLANQAGAGVEPGSPPARRIRK